jgi:hypothetical protein
MAAGTTTYLANPVVTINSVDCTDQAKTAVLTVKYGALESSAFGNTNRFYVSGMGDHELKIDLYMSYALTETYATLNALVGTQTTVKLQASAAAVSPTNPLFSLTNCYLESLDVVNATLGELSQISIVFKGGTYAAATSAP